MCKDNRQMFLFRQKLREYIAHLFNLFNFNYKNFPIMLSRKQNDESRSRT